MQVEINRRTPTDNAPLIEGTAGILRAEFAITNESGEQIFNLPGGTIVRTTIPAHEGRYIETHQKPSLIYVLSGTGSTVGFNHQTPSQVDINSVIALGSGATASISAEGNSPLELLAFRANGEELPESPEPMQDSRVFPITEADCLMTPENEHDVFLNRDNLFFGKVYKEYGVTVARSIIYFGAHGLRKEVGSDRYLVFNSSAIVVLNGQEIKVKRGDIAYVPTGADMDIKTDDGPVDYTAFILSSFDPKSIKGGQPLDPKFFRNRY